MLGVAAVFVKWAMAGGVAPATVGLYRMAFALPGVLLLARTEGPLRLTAGARWALLAGVAFAGDLNLWHLAMRHTSAANATFIVCGLTPVWVAVVSAVLGRRYPPIGWLGQLLGVAGALVLALARGARVGSGEGELLAVGASLSYAAFSLAVVRARRSLGARQALCWMSVGSLACFLLEELWLRLPLAGFSLRAWLALLGLGVLVQLLAWWLINTGLGHLDVALGALALGFQQVATPFLAAWWLAEPLRPLGLAGGAILMLGIYLVALGERTARFTGVRGRSR